MAESDRNHSSEMEARLDGKDHRWLSTAEICDVLRNPNGFTISEVPEYMPPSGSFFFFDKNVQRHFRKDGYEWKKTKDGKIVKEAHEKLKVEGVDVVHCYYAHREDDNDFQRRIYWLVDKNLSNMVLIHYRDIKVMPHTVSSNPSNFQHSQATYATNLNSTQTSEPENTVSASNHQASHGVLYVPGYEIASSISNSSNFQHSQAIDAINFPDFQDNWFENLFIDPSDGGIPENSCTGLPACTNSRAGSSAAVQPSHSSLGKRQCDSTNSKVTPLATTEGVDEEEEGNDTNQSRKRLKVTCGQKSIATSAATNITAAPESSTPAMLQSRPTSDANQDFENQEQELEPTSIEPENGKSKAVVQNDFGSRKRQNKHFAILEQLEQPIRDYSEYDKGKKLNAQVEDMRKLLEIKVQFCDSKMRDYQRLENERKQIVAKQAVICAEVGGAVKETERNQAELNELLPQRDQFIQNEANLKTSLVIGDGYWTILKKVIFDNLAL